MDNFIGEIRAFGCNFAPKGWAFCDGQLLSISQNTALFSLLGTYYGGDGKSTFGLPNMKGRIPISQGQGPGLSAYDLGQMSGTDTETLVQTEMPFHTHVMKADTSDAVNAQSPSGNLLGANANTAMYQTTTGNVQSMSPLAVPIVGNSLPHTNLMPYLVVNFCIALQGVYPARQ